MNVDKRETSNYPNLMYFGKDLLNCTLLENCFKYKECRKRYDETFFNTLEQEKQKDGSYELDTISTKEN